MDVFTIGDIKLDAFIKIPNASVLCRADRLTCELCIAHGKKIPVEETDTQIAGSAPNVAIGIKKMKKTSAVYSVMGQDSIYEQALSYLKKLGVGTQYISSKKGKKSSFSAVLNYKGESTQLASHSDIEFKLPRTIPTSKWIHLSELGEGYEKMFERLVKHVEKSKTRLIFNPGSLQIKERKNIIYKLIRVTDILVVNKLEAEQLLKKTKNGNMKRLLVELMQLGPGIVVITNGKKGAYSFDGENMDFAPMFPGARKEATGAGDAFLTGFLGAILHKKDKKTALAWGSVNASEVVQHIGPTAGLLSTAQIQKRLRSNKKYKVTDL